MGILNRLIRGKNKKFNYSPRFYDDKGKGNPYKMEQSLDKFRNDVHSSKRITGKINNAMDNLEKSGDRNIKLRMGIIIAILVLIFLYIIDFDLSIFSFY